MAKDKRSVRDGTGPYKDSFQKKTNQKVGKRQQNGEICPVLPPSVTKKKGKTL